MKKFLYIVCVAPSLAFAQPFIGKDSISVAGASADSLSLKDSVKTELVLISSNHEFIPGDETPELITDRLSCLQRSIPLDYNTKVQGFIDYFLVRDREYIRAVLRKKDLYFPLFEKKLREHHLPEELKYLSIIESGLNPRATSHAKAVGLWQFMSSTGRSFGLLNDWFTDDRQDPEKATEAACLFLDQLYTLFHDWHLALAAYNSGPGTVLRAIRKSGQKKTFWEIYNFLPRETRSYVPQYIAMIYAMNHAPEHNINEYLREEHPPHDTLAVNRFFHFDTFARLTSICPEDMQRLNPAVRGSALPEDGKNRVIKVPMIAKDQLTGRRKEVLDSAASKKKNWEVLAKNLVSNTPQTHRRDQNIYCVRSGDVLGTIARRFGVSVLNLREWNSLRGNMIRAGQKLIVWTAPSVGKVAPNPKAQPAVSINNSGAN